MIPVFDVDRWLGVGVRWCALGAGVGAAAAAAKELVGESASSKMEEGAVRLGREEHERAQSGEYEPNAWTALERVEDSGGGAHALK